jgi:hypothetical protein
VLPAEAIETGLPLGLRKWSPPNCQESQMTQEARLVFAGDMLVGRADKSVSLEILSCRPVRNERRKKRNKKTR